MRKAILLSLAVFVTVGQAPRAAGQADTDNAALAKEVQALRAELEAMKKELEVLKQRVEEQSVLAAARGEPRHPVDRARLKEIKLPENATDEQVRTYISEILAASQQQNAYTSNDPQVAMLARIGAGRVALLVDALRNEPGTGNYYLLAVIAQLVTEDDKDVILKELRRTKDLVRIVLERGWVRDARDTLVEVLNSQPRYVALEPWYLPVEWITAVASLRDPATYDALTKYLVHGANRGWTYRAIGRLPGIELAEAVSAAWREVQHGGRFGQYEVFEMAQVAACYGHLDALEFLVDSLDDKIHDRACLWDTQDMLVAIRAQIEFRGSEQEVVDWFRAHRNELVFDRDRQKFVLKEAKNE